MNWYEQENNLRTQYGMLRHAFERLDGGNLLWHIVCPPPPVPPIFSLFLIILHPIWFSLPVWLEVWLPKARGQAIQPIIKNIEKFSMGKFNKGGSCKLQVSLKWNLKMFELSPSSNINEGVELWLPYVINFLKKGCVWGNSLYEKLWDHLGKREKLDLESTKQIFWNSIFYFLFSVLL